MVMSSIITANASEDESILPEVEELSQFHPDQLSSLVDIQEELEKLEVNDDGDAVMALSPIDDVNVVVDHEVTIVADQANEEISILPEISETTYQFSNSMEKLSDSQTCKFNELKRQDIKEVDSFTVGSASSKEDSLVYSPFNLESSSDSFVPNSIATVLPLSSISQVKANKQVTDALKAKKTLASISHPKNVLTKVIFTHNNQASSDAPSFLFGESGKQTIKLIGQNKAIITNPSSGKAITFAQAKEMGLISPGKVHILPSQTKISAVTTISRLHNMNFEWHKRFKEGGDEIKDDPRSGRPSTSTTPENINNIGEVIRKNHRLSIHAVAEIVGIDKELCITKKNFMMSSNKTLTVVKSSPTKILPLPTSGHLHPIVSASTVNTLTPHKILIRQSPASMKTGTFSNTIVTAGSVGTTGHILQLPMTSQENNQIHQIHLPGKQVQYVRLLNSVSTTATTMTESMTVTSSNLSSARPVPIALTTNVSQKKMVPIAPVSCSVTQNTNSFERMLVSPGMGQLTSNSDMKTPTTNIVMVPAEYVKKYKPQVVNHSPPSPLKPVTSTNMATSSPPTPPPIPQPLPPVSTYFTKDKEVFAHKEAVSTPVAIAQKTKSSDCHNGIRPRKACNCTKSQCLKLYCDCFANGEFCFQCNCNCCFNNLDHEEDRQRAIKSCLERNPNAFRPKIGKGYVGDERRHNKGCNCKRSGCLKNYCECYEAKIPCSNNCKCVGCRNVEEMRIRDKCSIEGTKINQPSSVKSKLSCEIHESPYKPKLFIPNQNSRQPSNLMTQEVVEATCQCLLAQVESNYKLSEQVERLILEEFGRCLVEIIECATRTTVPNTI